MCCLFLNVIPTYLVFFFSLHFSKPRWIWYFFEFMFINQFLKTSFYINVVSFASDFLFCLTSINVFFSPNSIFCHISISFFLHLIPFFLLFLSMCVLYSIPLFVLFLSMFFVHLIVSWLLLVISWLLDLITTIILGFLNYAHWLKGCFWLNNMYVLTKGQNIEWHGYVLTNQFDYDDWFDHMSNNHLVKFDPQKITLIKRTML